jgi:hypothetical protein
MKNIAQTKNQDIQKLQSTEVISKRKPSKKAISHMQMIYEDLRYILNDKSTAEIRAEIINLHSTKFTF